jgi:hypothetical protein
VRLFATLEDNIRCAVVNACYSEAQAGRIVESVDCALGKTRAIPDGSAIAFAASFYQAPGYGRSTKTAFDLGRGQIDLPGTQERAPCRELVREDTVPKDHIPRFKVAPGVDAATIDPAAPRDPSSPLQPGRTGGAASKRETATTTTTAGETHYSCFISCSPEVEESGFRRGDRLDG